MRIARRAIALPALFAALAVLVLAGPAVAQKTIDVGGASVVLTCRALQPGEAILARLKDDPAIRRVKLVLGDQVRVLESDGEGGPGSREALLGIDLGTTQPELVLKAKVETREGTVRFLDFPLAIGAKEFPSTKFQVPAETVTPPPEELETIRRESALVAEVLSGVSPDWLADGPFQSPLPDYEPYPNFGQRRVYNKAISSVHAGVDISAPRGTRAAAPNGGRVVLASKLFMSGWTVIIDHGRGVFSYCCHFDKLLVKRGELVRKGQAIALVGSTGRSTGPHLHWAARIGPKRVDPFSLLVLPID